MINQERQEINEAIVQRAMKDSNFRQELLTDANTAVANEFDIHLPSNIKLNVVEESGDNLYLVLPQGADDLIEGELTDAELEAVAGGWCNNTCSGGTCVNTSSSPRVY